MAEVTRNNIPHEVEREMNSILGQVCCRQHVGNDGSLFLGFGGIFFTKTSRGEAPHGKWEVGTYRSAWRIVENQSIICGSKEAIDSVEELRPFVGKLEGATCAKISMLTEFDVRVEFGKELSVDFMAACGDGDEVFHAFLAQGQVASFSSVGGWVLAASRKP